MASDKAVLDAFNRFDTDGSGSISREELGEAPLEGAKPKLWKVVSISYSLIRDTCAFMTFMCFLKLRKIVDE